MNSEIKKLHSELIKLHQALDKRLDGTTDQEDALAILREMEALSLRIILAQNLLFKETTAAIDDSIQTVVATRSELEQSLDRVERTKELIAAVGKFLTVADKVMDAIKLA